MAVTTKGFQGTISDADMATQFPHHQPTVYGAGDLAVTAVGGARTVSVAIGGALAGFVKYASDAAQQLTLAPPASGGKWYAITINRQWSPTNTAVLQADDLGVSDTNGTIVTLPPVAAVTAAANLPNQPGTAGSTAGQRQVLALVYVRAADTTLGIYDLRAIATSTGVLLLPTILAMIFNNQRHFRDGAVVAVAAFTAPRGGLHFKSVWQRIGGAGAGLLQPVGRIVVNENGGNVRADLIDYATFGYALPIGLQSDDTEVFDVNLRILYGWDGPGFYWPVRGLDRWRCVVQMEGAVNVPTGTSTEVPFSRVISDPSGNMQPAGFGTSGQSLSRIRIPFTGLYRISARLAFGGGGIASGNYRGLDVYQIKNAGGTGYLSNFGTADAYQSDVPIETTFDCLLNAGDQVYMAAYQQAGNTRQLSYGSDERRPKLSVHYLGPA